MPSVGSDVQAFTFSYLQALLPDAELTRTDRLEVRGYNLSRRRTLSVVGITLSVCAVSAAEVEREGSSCGFLIRARWFSLWVRQELQQHNGLEERELSSRTAPAVGTGHGPGQDQVGMVCKGCFEYLSVGHFIVAEA
ncbi:hypothetical protein WMY93_011397 [Mugilogobius chulae]|uniref:Uncharacterized protein n=1 Tax=Mugilogobius chulae TaxID=88201 RepID=A0AAW0P8A4_9GOBI